MEGLGSMSSVLRRVSFMPSAQISLLQNRNTDGKFWFCWQFLGFFFTKDAGLFFAGSFSCRLQSCGMQQGKWRIFPIRRANLMVKFTEVLNHPIKSPVGFRFGDVIVPHKPVVFPTFLPFSARFRSSPIRVSWEMTSPATWTAIASDSQSHQMFESVKLQVIFAWPKDPCGCWCHWYQRRVAQEPMVEPAEGP